MFLVTLHEDNRFEIRRHLCVLDRFALARTCKALRDEDYVVTRGDVVALVPVAWRRSMQRNGAHLFTRFVQTWTFIFNTRLDDPTVQLFAADDEPILGTRFAMYQSLFEMEWPRSHACISIHVDQSIWLGWHERTDAWGHIVHFKTTGYGHGAIRNGVKVIQHYIHERDARPPEQQ